MKDRALKVAGSIFLVIGLLQLTRFLLRVRVVAAGYEVPVVASAIAAAVLFALAAWMFQAAR